MDSVPETAVQPIAAIPPAATPLLNAVGLSKQFGATQALRDVSISFHAGEVHCLLGENGAGKSTLAKLFGGLYEPDKGRIAVMGRTVRLRSVADARLHRISVVFQELSLAPDLTVQENICLGTERGYLPLRLTRRRHEAKLCRSLLAEFGISLDLDVPVRRLSIANQQLVEVAKALAQRPRLLILDEPTAMLGMREKQKLLDMIRRLKTEGMAVIFVTHHIEEMLEVGDRVSLMRDGAVVDSFPVSAALRAGDVVEKLAGRRISQEMAAQSGATGPQMLQIQGLADTGGGTRDIVVGAGEVVGLYGVMGCGREQIGDALVGLAGRPQLTMRLDGKRYRPRSPAAAARHGVAYLPSGRATNGILAARSIRENLTLAQPAVFRRVVLISARRERSLATRQLTQLRTRFANQEDPITALSGGNQQKVLMGRCLERGSKLLVLEDPTAGVDVGAKHDIHELIRQRAASSVAVLLLSGDLRETITLCDTVYTIRDGQIAGVYRAPTLADEQMIIADILGGTVSEHAASGSAAATTERQGDDAGDAAG